jgi:hypothetical protein
MNGMDPMMEPDMMMDDMMMEDQKMEEMEQPMEEQKKEDPPKMDDPPKKNDAPPPVVVVPPPADNVMMEDDADDTKNPDDEGWDEEDHQPHFEWNKSACCCCDCVCSNDKTSELTCCGCFPIKCGIVTIGLLTVMLTVILFVWYFFQFMNDYVHWWATLINLILLSPFLIACAFFVCFSTLDSLRTRALLPTACILILTSISLICIWQLCYFIWIYKRSDFY